MDRYEEALEKARELHGTVAAGRDFLAEIFPELRESEDERIRKAIMEVLKRVSGATDVLENQGTTFKKAMIWLEKQKESTWTKEDENMRDNILRFLGCFVGTSECDSNPSLSVSYPAYQREMAWLKSLRPPQYCENCKLKRSVENWKPSEEQMSMLLAVINDPNNAGAESCHLMLQSLYAGLKKLL